MPHPELELISNILNSGDFNTPKKKGLTAEWFTLEAARDAYQWLWDEYHDPQQRGEVPTVDRFLRKFPSFDYTPSRNSLNALITDVRTSKVQADLQHMLNEMQDELVDGEDPSLILDSFLPKFRRMNVEAHEDDGILLSSSVAILKQQYSTHAESGGVVGIPYPWEILNQKTGGMRDEEFIVIYGRPANMKCVVEGQRIMMPNGDMIPIEDLPDLCTVSSFTDATMSMRWAAARRVVSGEKECVRVTTESGRVIETSTEHYFMVPEGSFEGKYDRIRDLHVGSWIATARSVPDWSSENHDPKLGWLLGALTGDGNYTRSEVQFTNHDSDVVSSLRSIALTYNCKVNSGSVEGEYRVVSYDTHKNKILDLLRELGMHGKKGPEKEVPSWIFRSSRQTIAAYLSGLLDTDGTVRSAFPSRVAWYTSSPRLARDIQHLLARLGISRAGISVDAAKEQRQISVYGADQYRILLKVLGPYLSCMRKRTALEDLAKETGTSPNNDGIPCSRRLEGLILEKKGAQPWPRMGKSKLDRSKLFRRSGCISRALLEKMATEWGSAELALEAQTQIRWERIKSIEPIGRKPCYDVCIQDGQDPNFVVEDFVVHNTWVACVIAAHAYLMNYRVMVFSKEISREAMLTRISSILGNVDYDRLRRGLLSEEDAEEFFELMEELAETEEDESVGAHHRALLFMSDKGKKSGSTVEDLIAAAERFQPDLIVVDGFYLMRDGRSGQRTADWKQISHISQDLKGMAQFVGCPVVGTTQANRANAKEPTGDVDDLSFADGIGQDADIAFRVFKGPNPSGRGASLLFVFSKSRETVIPPFIINASPGSDFSVQQAHANVKAFLELKAQMEMSEGADGDEGGGSGGKKEEKKKPKKRDDPFRA